MIGEGIQSTNQRKHSYVSDRVEVGFFTDPSVCIGCKACGVACKEWNQVRTTDSHGREIPTTTPVISARRPGATLCSEQDRQKGNQIVGSHSLVDGDADDPFRWVFLPMCASTAKKRVV
jgi:hypothetical protein